MSVTAPASLIPSHNLDAERAVLGVCLLEGREAMAVVAEALRPADFFTDGHRVIYESMLRLNDAGRGVDLITVTDDLRQAGHLDLAGGPPGLALLIEQGCIAAYLDDYIAIIKAARTKRELTVFAMRIASTAQNGTPAREALRLARQQLEEIMGAATGAVDIPLYDAADDWEFPGPTFIIDQLIPTSGTLWVGGLPKRGKRLLLLYLVLAIACRRHDVFGRFTVLEFPKILYVTREDGGARLNERRADILSAWNERPEPGALRFAIKPRIDLLNPEHIAGLRDTCRREGRTVLVLDTWTALSPGADPLSPKDQAQLAAVVVQLAEDIRGLVVVVDHSRKNRPEGSILSSADIFGAPQKWAAAEHIVMLDHAGSDDRWEIFVEGKDADSTRFFLAKSARGSAAEKLLYAGSSDTVANAARAKGSATRQAVLSAIQSANDWISTAELSATLKVSADTVQRHAKALVESKAIKRRGKGPRRRYRAVGESPQEPCAANSAEGGEKTAKLKGNRRRNRVRQSPRTEREPALDGLSPPESPHAELSIYAAAIPAAIVHGAGEHVPEAVL